MKRSLLIAMAMGSCAAGSSLAADPLGDAYRSAVKKISPGLVRIEITGVADARARGTAITTGIVVASDGWIITSNFHFPARPAGIVVEQETGEKLPARLVATDHRRRLSLLKVEATDLTVPRAALTRDISPGETAIAVGKVWDTAEPSFTVGIVSAVGRIWGLAIQTDAKISPMNYGGPLVALDGSVLGILTPIDPQSASESAGYQWYDSGIGFAIPLVDVLESLPRLQKGDISIGRTGMLFRDEDSVMAAPLIANILWRSPAWKSGLRPGDHITEVDGTPIERRVQMLHQLGRKQAGDVVTLTARRNNERLLAKLQLAAEIPTYRWPMLGISVRENNERIEVDAVLDASPAAKAGLPTGAILTSAEGKSIQSRADLRRLIDERAPGEQLKLRWEKDGRTREASITLTEFPSNHLPPSLRAEAKKPEKPTEISFDEGRRKYWAVAPEFDADAHAPGIVLTFLSSQTTNLNILTQRWAKACAEEGLVLIAVPPMQPNGWSAADQENVLLALHDAIKRFRIDDQRILVHGAQVSGILALQFARANPELVRGLLLAGGPLPPLPLMQPSNRHALAVIWAERDSRSKSFAQGLNQIQRQGYPTFGGPRPLMMGAYPSAEIISEWARWTLLFRYL